MLRVHHALLLVAMARTILLVVHTVDEVLECRVANGIPVRRDVLPYAFLGSDEMRPVKTQIA